MTYEEARQYLIDARYTDGPLDETLWDEAMDAATEALKSKNDLIDEVLKIIDGCKIQNPKNEGAEAYNIMLWVMMQEVKNLKDGEQG